MIICKTIEPEIQNPNINDTSDEEKQSMSPVLMDSEFTLSQENQTIQFSDTKQKLTTYNSEDFEKIACLGTGASASVWECIHRPTRKKMAVKYVNKQILIQTNGIEGFQNEIKVMTTLTHPYINVAHGIFQTNAEFGIVMNIHSGGELFGILLDHDVFPSGMCRKYAAAEIIVALEYLHKNGHMYRDLKAENVLVTNDGYIVLSDFGSSKWIADPENRTRTRIGTIDYMAPEIIACQPYSMKVDVWSFGILLFEMFAEQSPFEIDEEGTCIMEKYRRILQDFIPYPLGMDPVLIDLLEEIFYRDPKDRISLAQIRSHEFFSNVDWKAIENRNIPHEYVIRIDKNLPSSENTEIENFEE